MTYGTEETTMSQKSKDAGLDRRNFFKALGAGATAAVAPVAVTPAAAVDPGKDETKARYRESEHVKDFYRVNRY
ncbi:formate dehydrogenase [Bosea sp. LjRoot90]|uniref:formate dehydrogenase n=1 Tax=Bosea sp. LjRoot90 TaxID=3342342 RepID=UPI003F4FB56C